VFFVFFVVQSLDLPIFGLPGRHAARERIDYNARPLLIYMCPTP
jgi:hypothetical protein